MIYFKNFFLLALYNSDKKMTSVHKQRDFNKDLNNVLDFFQERGFYYQQGGERINKNKIACLGINSRYFIKRASTDGDEITYYFMERTVDEDNCDEYKEIFSISLDFYDLETDLLDTFRKSVAKNNML